jgi:hypothetical protein
MLEILIIIGVSKKIAAMMKEKGRSAAGYVVIFVFLWIFGELTGGVIGVIAAAQNNAGRMNDGFDWQILVGALLGAAIGGGTGYAIASAMPAVDDERQRYLDTLDDDDRRDRDERVEEEDEEDRPRRRRRVENDDGRFEDSSR